MSRLSEVFWLFLRLGVTAFGGPAAHIALMREEVVKRCNWLSEEDFLDLIGAANLIPGPNSTEVAIHIGHLRAGWPGLVVAGVVFILPAALIVGAIAWVYKTYGALPQITGLLYGVKPVVIAVVTQALVGLGKSAVKSKGLAILGTVALCASFLKVDELVVLFGAGIVALLWKRHATPSRLLGFIPYVAVATPGAGLGAIFLIFLKIGSVLFGSGYVLLAFLQTELVDRRHWLATTQLLDAVAVGQVTPGPVFTTATFIGYLLAGAPGAAVATIGIFLPAFVFVALSRPLIPKLRSSPSAGAFLDGVNVASLALMAEVLFQLSRSAIVDWVTLLLAVVAAILLLRFKVNATWVVLGGAIVGALRP